MRSRTTVASHFIRDEVSGLFRLEPEPPLGAEVLDFIRNRVSRALCVALDTASHNGLTSDAYEAVLIQLAIHPDNTSPSILATELYDASLSLSRNVGSLYPDDTSLQNLQKAILSAKEEICENDHLARARCARMASWHQIPPIIGDDKIAISKLPDIVSGELDREAEEEYRRAVTIITDLPEAPISVRARLTQWTADIWVGLGFAMQGDRRLQWLGEIVNRLKRWWPDD